MLTATIGSDSHFAASTGLGTGLVIISTVAIATVPSFARLAYDGGSNTLTVITARSILWYRSHAPSSFSPADAAHWPEAAVPLHRRGVCYAIMLYGFLGAVEFIPVNTVILIFFVHPVIVGLVAARLGNEAHRPDDTGAAQRLAG